MPIVSDKQAIINLAQPLLLNQTIEAAGLISTEPTAGGIAKAAVNSGIVGGLLSSIGLGRASQAATDAVNNTEGSAIPQQFYLIATNLEIVFVNADVLEPPRISYQMPYTDLVSVESGMTQIIFKMKSGKQYKYFAGNDTIKEMVLAIQKHLAA